MPLRTLVTHDQRLRYQHEQEFLRSWFQLSWITVRDSVWTSVEEITKDVIKIAGELELEMEPKDLIELMQPYDKT